MSYDQFLSDLKTKGIPAENAVVEIMKKWDKSTYRVEGYDKGKDVVSPELGMTFEVKSQPDARTHVSIEVAIENQTGRHDSGITTSEADYWVIYCHNTYHFIRIERLRFLLLNIPIKKHLIGGQTVSIKTIRIDEDLAPNCRYIYQGKTPH